MKYIISIICLSLLLSSCGTFKNITKNKEKYKESIEESINKTTDTSIKDNSIITIEEKIDTNIIIPSKKIDVETPIKSLLDINNIILVQNDLVTVKQNYDTINKSLKTTIDLIERTIPVNKKKKTTINKNIDTKIKSKQDSIVVKKTELKIIDKKKEINIKAIVITTITIIIILSMLIFIIKKIRK